MAAAAGVVIELISLGFDIGGAIKNWGENPNEITEEEWLFAPVFYGTAYSKATPNATQYYNNGFKGGQMKSPHEEVVETNDPLLPKYVIKEGAKIGLDASGYPVFADGKGGSVMIDPDDSTKYIIEDWQGNVTVDGVKRWKTDECEAVCEPEGVCTVYPCKGFIRNAYIGSEADITMSTPGEANSELGGTPSEQGDVGNGYEIPKAPDYLTRDERETLEMFRKICRTHNNVHAG